MQQKHPMVNRSQQQDTNTTLTDRDPAKQQLPQESSVFRSQISSNQPSYRHLPQWKKDWLRQKGHKKINMKEQAAKSRRLMHTKRQNQSTLNVHKDRHRSHQYQFDIDMGINKLNQSQDTGILDFPNIAGRIQISTLDKNQGIHQSLEQPHRRHANDFAHDFDLKMILQNSNKSSVGKLPQLKNYYTEAKKPKDKESLLADDSIVSHSRYDYDDNFDTEMNKVMQSGNISTLINQNSEEFGGRKKSLMQNQQSVFELQSNSISILEGIVDMRNKNEENALVLEKIRYQIREKDDLEKKKASTFKSRHGSTQVQEETKQEKREKYEKGRNFKEFQKEAVKNDIQKQRKHTEENEMMKLYEKHLNKILSTRDYMSADEIRYSN